MTFSETLTFIVEEHPMYLAIFLCLGTGGLTLYIVQWFDDHD